MDEVMKNQKCIELTEWEKTQTLAVLNMSGISRVPFGVLVEMMELKENLDALEPKNGGTAVLELSDIQADHLYKILTAPNLEWATIDKSLAFYHKVKNLVD